MNTDQRQKHGHISWGELCTTDTEAAKAFYNKLFGWDYDSSKSTCNTEYSVASSEKEPVAGIMNLSDIPHPEGVPPHWGMYVTVDCIDTAIETVKQEGGSIVVEKRALDCGSYFAFIKDPQGAFLGLFEYPKEQK
jgi:uncharacterized protein